MEIYENEIIVCDMNLDVNCSDKSADNLTYLDGNESIYFGRPSEMLEPWNINPYFFPILITYIITFIVGVSGNIIVISVMAGDRANRSVTSIFLVSLAVADLLLLVICAPLDVAHYFVIQWDREGTICKLAAYAECVSAFASVLNLVAVSFERYVVIVFPIRSRSLCTMSNCKKIMVIVWMLSLLLATPVIFTKNTVKTTFANNQTSVTLYSCKELYDWKGFSVNIYRFVTLFALPSVVMIVCYLWVIIELWISTKTMDELTHNRTVGQQSCQSLEITRSESRASISHEQITPIYQSPTRYILRSHTNDNRDVKRARQQVIKMLILVVLLFLICWGPRLVMEIIIKCCLSLMMFNNLTYMLRIIFYLSPFVHSCLNPIVYGFMSTKFRRRMFRVFDRICFKVCRKSRTSAQHKNKRMSTSMSNSNSMVRNSRITSTYTFSSFGTSLSSPQNNFLSVSQTSLHI
ncbi:allatostatin-A receptor-like [Oppia nitens]|uniref:allatostatin-A receptor-like n=1 Tax=Oppia nitens TaxID=1686743 RepID=UPI0023DC77B6|nr:allatostatin-A receptor-like [Oppia nitens]